MTQNSRICEPLLLLGREEASLLLIEELRPESHLGAEFNAVISLFGVYHFHICGFIFLKVLAQLGILSYKLLDRNPDAVGGSFSQNRHFDSHVC
uniref:Uncharacterized protein n=1 Tax=Cucumis melo TaxID=3656 RepID=A0A9I9E821_CUCME